MSSTAAGSSMSYGRPGRNGGMIHIDAVTVAIVLAIALLGLVMVTSASVSIASKDTGETFFYLERQLVLMLIGGACAVLLFCIPTRLLEKVSVPLLVVAIAMLMLVFVPGLGHTVNGSRRWLSLLGLNFQERRLASVGGAQFSGVRAGAGAGHRLPGQLRGAS